MDGIPCPFSLCELVLCRRKLLVNHLREDHYAKTPPTLVCKINKCFKTYHGIRSYDKHLIREHIKLCHNLENATRPSLDNNEAENGIIVHTNIEECFNDKEIDHANNESQQFLKRLLMICLKNREKYNLPHSVFNALTLDIFNEFGSLYYDVISSITQRETLSDTACNLLGNDLANPNFIFSIRDIISNKNDFKMFCVSQGLVEPKTITIGDNCTFQYIPILNNLKTFIGHMSDSMQLTVCNSESDGVEKKLRSFTDGWYFKSHSFFSGNKQLLRLHMYVDDVELCNPLGSSKKKNKLTCFYCFVGNIGVCNYASLKNILPIIFVETQVLNQYGYEEVLKPFIGDIKILEEIGIMSKNSTNTLYGTVATLSGDNLAAHDIGGFRRCFSSGKICRYCMISYDDLKTVFEKDHFIPRTQKQYENQLYQVSCDSSLSSTYGVQKACALSRIAGFSPVSSIPPDCMHDCLEGVITYTLQAIFVHFHVHNILSITKMNQLIKDFDFGQSDAKNKPRCSPVFGVVQSDGRVALCASESWCLFRLLPLILLHNIEFRNEQIWRLYVLLSETMEVVFAPEVSEYCLGMLQLNLEEFCQTMAHLAPQYIKPKFHFLLHYPDLIRKFGPLRHLWCMRFEAFHSKVKEIARSVKNFKNISYSVAKRVQLTKCWQFSESPTKNIEVVGNKQVLLLDLDNQVQEFFRSNFEVDNASLLFTCKTLNFNGTAYSVNGIHVIDTLNNIPVFCKLKCIIQHDENFVICSKYLNPIKFQKHLQSYEVKETEKLIFFRPGCQLTKHMLDIYNINNTLYIRMKYIV